MKLAAVQYRPPKGNPARAREELTRLIREAGRHGADLIVCPEMATSGYVWANEDAVKPHAETATAETAALLCALADEVQAWIVCGFPEQAGALLFNSALVARPDGTLASCYRKMLLYEADMTWACPGAERVCLETPLGRLAPAICMDLNDNDLLRFLHRSRVDVLAFCTNWIEENSDVHAYWRWRLLHWPGWLVAANTWGEDAGTVFSGRSAILAPTGAVVAQAPARGNTVIMVDTEQLSPADLRLPPTARLWPW